MKIQNHLKRLFKVILEEADSNPEFAKKIAEAVSENLPQKPEKGAGHAIGPRPANRRAPAVLDPLLLVKDGEAALRRALEGLSLEQLRDIVAEYGMDSGKLVMKWVTPERVIERIVELSISRVNKGHAFRRGA